MFSWTYTSISFSVFFLALPFNKKCGLRDLQKTLILNLLNESNLDYDDDDDLSIKIMNRLCHKRILLVLDGVDGLDGPYQLKMLAREHDWFG